VALRTAAQPTPQPRPPPTSLGQGRVIEVGCGPLGICHSSRRRRIAVDPLDPFYATARTRITSQPDRDYREGVAERLRVTATVRPRDHGELIEPRSGRTGCHDELNAVLNRSVLYHVNPHRWAIAPSHLSRCSSMRHPYTFTQARVRALLRDQFPRPRFETGSYPRPGGRSPIAEVKDA